MSIGLLALFRVELRRRHYIFCSRKYSRISQKAGCFFHAALSIKQIQWQCNFTFTTAGIQSPFSANTIAGQAFKRYAHSRAQCSRFELCVLFCYKTSCPTRHRLRRSRAVSRNKRTTHKLFNWSLSIYREIFVLVSRLIRMYLDNQINYYSCSVITGFFCSNTTQFRVSNRPSTQLHQKIIEIYKPNNYKNFQKRLGFVYDATVFKLSYLFLPFFPQVYIYILSK